MFDTHLFEKELSTSWLGRELFFFDELDSTNNYAKDLDRETSKHGAVVLTDDQTAGRGQYDRVWETEKGENLTLSIISEPSSGDRLTVLTLANALAVADTLEEISKQPSSIKWPNDVFIGDKKIAGLLTETQFKGEELERVIIGIGINVNQTEFVEDLQETATSLKLISSDDSSRERLLARILSRIEFYYRLWETKEIELIKMINKKIIGYGQWTRLSIEGKQSEAEFKFLGINETGQMVVLNKELEVNTFSYEQVRVHFDSTAD